MPKEISRTEQWNAPIKDCYQILTDYSSYPDFVPSVQSLEVISQNDEGACVLYSINVIKKFQYTLDLTHTPPQSIHWSLKSGDFFKENNGSWELKEVDSNNTEVTYSLSIEVKRFVPQMIIDSLVGKQLPAMMKAFHQRILENLS